MKKYRSIQHSLALTIGLALSLRVCATLYSGEVGVPGRFIDSAQKAISGPRSQSFHRSVALGDLDGDGDLDVWSANDGPDIVWINDGQGQFVDNGQSFEERQSTDVDLMDLDGDNDIDACVINGGFMQVWINNGQGRFTGNRHFALALGDLDSDDDVDAWIMTPFSNQVLLNDGQGKFAASGQTLLNDDEVKLDNYGNVRDSSFKGADNVALGDLDGDGDLDAWVRRSGQGPPEDNGGDVVWLNDGTGKFSKDSQELHSLRPIGDGVAVGDLDGDSDLDVWSGDIVLLNDGRGKFSSTGQRMAPGPNSWTVDVVLGDVDGDGDLDAFCANEGTFGLAYDQVWLNNGTARFADSGQELGPANFNLSRRREDGSYGPALGANSYGVELGDLDGDGDLDAWVAESATGARVWLNGAIPEVRISRRDGNVVIDYRGTLFWSDSPTGIFNGTVVSWSSPYVVPLDHKLGFFIAR